MWLKKCVTLSTKKGLFLASGSRLGLYQSLNIVVLDADVDADADVSWAFLGFFRCFVALVWSVDHNFSQDAFLFHQNEERG